MNNVVASTIAECYTVQSEILYHLTKLEQSGLKGAENADGVLAFEQCVKQFIELEERQSESLSQLHLWLSMIENGVQSEYARFCVLSSDFQDFAMQVYESERCRLNSYYIDEIQAISALFTQKYATTEENIQIIVQNIKLLQNKNKQLQHNVEELELAELQDEDLREQEDKKITELQEENTDLKEIVEEQLEKINAFDALNIENDKLTGKIKDLQSQNYELQAQCKQQNGSIVFSQQEYNSSIQLLTETINEQDSTIQELNLELQKYEEMTRKSRMDAVEKTQLVQEEQQECQKYREEMQEWREEANLQLKLSSEESAMLQEELSQSKQANQRESDESAQLIGVLQEELRALEASEAQQATELFAKTARCELENEELMLENKQLQNIIAQHESNTPKHLEVLHDRVCGIRDQLELSDESLMQLSQLLSRCGAPSFTQLDREFNDVSWETKNAIIRRCGREATAEREEDALEHQATVIERQEQELEQEERRVKLLRTKNLQQHEYIEELQEECQQIADVTGAPRTEDILQPVATQEHNQDTEVPHRPEIWLQSLGTDIACIKTRTRSLSEESTHFVRLMDEEFSQVTECLTQLDGRFYLPRHCAVGEPATATKDCECETVESENQQLCEQNESFFVKLGGVVQEFGRELEAGAAGEENESAAYGLKHIYNTLTQLLCRYEQPFESPINSSCNQGEQRTGERPSSIASEDEQEVNIVSLDNECSFSITDSQERLLNQIVQAQKSDADQHVALAPFSATNGYNAIEKQSSIIKGFPGAPALEQDNDTLEYVESEDLKNRQADGGTNETSSVHCEEETSDNGEQTNDRETERELAAALKRIGLYEKIITTMKNHLSESYLNAHNLDTEIIKIVLGEESLASKELSELENVLLLEK